MIGDWIAKNKKKIVRFMFLIPIFAVAAISISHVVSWYDLANPFTWAVYLSIAVEIGAMSAIAATSVKIRGLAVWVVFIIVTIIQFIGNIFFCYAEIDPSSIGFNTWVELTAPVFEAIGSDMDDIIAQRRWLATLQGGLLPIISLACLHFFIQYDGDDEIDNNKEEHYELEQEPVEVKEDNTKAAKESRDIAEVKVPVKPKQGSKQEVKKADKPKKGNNGGNLSPKMKRILGT